jgi:hypothetical protein
MKPKKDNVIHLFPHLSGDSKSKYDVDYIDFDQLKTDEDNEYKEVIKINEMIEEEEKKFKKLIGRKIKTIDKYEDTIKNLLIDDVNDMIRFHKLYLNNKLKKKEKIDKIIENKDIMIEKILKTLTYEELTDIKKIAKKGGKSKIDINKLEIQKSLCYRIKGIIFTATYEGELIEYIPGDILEITQTYVNDIRNIKRSKETSEIFIIAKGVLSYYGGVREQKLVSLIMEYLKIDTDDKKCREDIIDRLMYIGEMGLDWHRTAGGIYLHEEFEFLEDLVCDDSEYEYYPITYKEASFAGKNGYTKFEKHHNDFIRFICKNFSVTINDANMILVEFMDRVKWGEEPDEVTNDICSYFEFSSKEEVEEFVSKLIIVFDNTPLWSIRGNKLKMLEENN